MIMATALIGATFVGCGKNEQSASTEQVSTEGKKDDVQQEEREEVEEGEKEEAKEEIKAETEQEGTQGATGEQEEMIEEIIENEEAGMGEKDPTPSDEAYYVATNGLEESMSMTADANMLADAYGLDAKMLASYRVEMGMNRAAVSEIAVFEVKDEAGIEKVKEGISKRQEALEKQWESYLEEQYKLVKNAQTVINGNMILYVIGNDQAQIIEQFNGLLF